jgi:hypothetical protein
VLLDAGHRQRVQGLNHQGAHPSQWKSAVAVDAPDQASLPEKAGVCRAI